ncbi:unnamed protein product, partial [Strongylus vulgaris]
GVDSVVAASVGVESEFGIGADVGTGTDSISTPGGPSMYT